jgi:predicted nucleic acid-binding Zn ribbon protein
MTYLYQCTDEKCQGSKEVTEVCKPMSESSRKEFCPLCGGEMKRVYTSPGVKTSDGYKS